MSVELAGAKRDDVNAEVHDGVLTIRGEKKSEREEEDEKAIKATFENGVLCVEIAKHEDRTPKVTRVC